MISNHIIQETIDDLKGITRVDLCIVDMEGIVAATTFECKDITKELISNFASSPADSQTVGDYHMLKVKEDRETAYVLISKGNGADAYMIGRIAVSQIQRLLYAYKEHYDKNNFFQNLIMDNMLLVDIYSRAKKLHIALNTPRIVLLVEAQNDKDNIAMEFLKGVYGEQPGYYITAVEQNHTLLIKELSAPDDYADAEKEAQNIVDIMNTEAMLATRVSYGTIVTDLKEVSKSYNEAKMAMDVGKIFYMEKSVSAYNTLGIGRLIYQLPVNLCRIFMKEIFGDNVPDDLDEEMLITVQKFFENNLNVSETSRQLFVHRNTLVYRLEKLHQSTGLDIRKFDDALTFKIALMVVNYMNYIDSME